MEDKKKKKKKGIIRFGVWTLDVTCVMGRNAFFQKESILFVRGIYIKWNKKPSLLYWEPSLSYFK